MFQKALKIGKQIRSKILVGQGMPDLDYMFRQPSDAKILLVGASEINRKIFTFFKGKKIQDITLCNRSHNTTSALTEKYQLKTLDWQKLTDWHLYDWIIFGTKCPEYIVKRDDLPQEIVTNHIEKTGNDAFEMNAEEVIKPYRDMVVIESSLRDIKSFGTVQIKVTLFQTFGLGIKHLI